MDPKFGLQFQTSNTPGQYVSRESHAELCLETVRHNITVLRVHLHTSERSKGLFPKETAPDHYCQSHVKSLQLTQIFL
jgi:hypothetical protein